MPEPSPTDLLLYWLSARGTMGVGTWRAGCRNLTPPPKPGCQDPKGHYLRYYHRFKEALLRAGHIEFDPKETKVRPTPPTILRTSPETGYLCGARLPSLLGYLEKQDLKTQVTPNQPGPAVWRVQGNLVDFETELSRIVVHPDRGEAVLRSLPSASLVLQALPTERHPTAVSWERLEVRPHKSRHQVRWVDHKGFPTTGLYRQAKRQPPDVWLFEGDKARPLPNLDHRRLAHWRTVGRADGWSLKWSAKAADLELPRCGARLPLLVDRFLRSASGEEPRFDRGKRLFRYRDVDLTRARHVARILEWPLETDD